MLGYTDHQGLNQKGSTMSRHISLNITDELSDRIVDCAKGDEVFNDTVRRLLDRAAKPVIKNQAVTPKAKPTSSPHVKAKTKPTAWNQLKASAKKSR